MAAVGSRAPAGPRGSTASSQATRSHKVGNLGGGLGFVTLARILQVRGEPEPEDKTASPSSTRTALAPVR